jgi:hypothetical protein
MYSIPREALIKEKRPKIYLLSSIESLLCYYIALAIASINIGDDIRERCGDGNGCSPHHYTVPCIAD